MIISRTPFRISFIGGGSDLEAFYQRQPGCVLSTSINKYMYLSIHPFFYADKIQLKYSKTELVEHSRDIAHPIFRTAVQKFDIKGVEIDSVADIPHGTGLGSSSAFTVGLLHILYAYTGKYVSKERLAAEACDIEIKQLGEPIGKQDQYASSYGGMNLFTFYGNGMVDIEPVILPQGRQQELEANLMMFFTGVTRPAATILNEQRSNIEKERRTFDALCQMAEMARELRIKLSGGDIDALGRTLHQGWLLKRQMAATISNETIDRFYRLAQENGAIGGKLLGAGGGGFLLLYVYPDDQERVRLALSGLKELRCHFDFGGTKIIYVGDKFQ